MKVVVFEVQAWEREPFEQLQGEFDLVLTEDPLTPDNAGDYADAQVVATFVYSELRAPTLGLMPSLELIATRSTGYDHVDAERCEELGIAVANVPTYGSETVAEHVFALLLALARHLPEAVARTRDCKWQRAGLLGMDLQGKRLGIVGSGDIGQHVAKIARGFGMEVVAFDVMQDLEIAEEFGFEYVPMGELLETSDVVSLHVPETPKTRHMIGADQLASMKDGALLINTSRGGIVDTIALLDALESGKLAGAGLDVLEGEPAFAEEAQLCDESFEEREEFELLETDRTLMKMEQVVMTPHSAFYTREAVMRIVETTIENIRAWAAGEPQNVVIRPGEPARRT